MDTTKIMELNKITDQNGTQLLRMWKVQVPAGKRPLQHHRHLNFEIMYVNSGSGTYTTESAEYPILPGDLFVFSSNEFHCITDVGEEGLQITNLHFNPQFLWSAIPENTTHLNFNFCFFHHPDFVNRIVSSDADSIPFLFQQIAHELAKNKLEYLTSIKALIQLLLISLIRNHNYLNTHPEVNGEQIHNIQHTLSFIDEHFSDKITLQELSALAGLTPTYFSTLFKQVTGISLWNYITSKRIDKAIRLITSENYKGNMLDAAIECGFNNTANFNKTFKKITGVTPTEYKSGKYSDIS